MMVTEETAKRVADALENLAKVVEKLAHPPMYAPLPDAGDYTDERGQVVSWARQGYLACRSARGCPTPAFCSTKPCSIRPGSPLDATKEGR